MAIGIPPVVSAQSQFKHRFTAQGFRCLSFTSLVATRRYSSVRVPFHHDCVQRQSQHQQHDMSNTPRRGGAQEVLRGAKQMVEGSPNNGNGKLATGGAPGVGSRVGSGVGSTASSGANSPSATATRTAASEGSPKRAPHPPAPLTSSRNGSADHTPSTLSPKNHLEAPPRPHVDPSPRRLSSSGLGIIHSAGR